MRKGGIIELRAFWIKCEQNKKDLIFIALLPSIKMSKYVIEIF